MSMYENSRYLYTPLYTRRGDNTNYLKIRKRFHFNANNCTTHVWTETDALDRLAYFYYGFAALRWVFLEANVQYRSEYDIKVGDEILVPDYNEVIRLVNV